MLPEVSGLIRKFSLQSHPEGGFYRETYRSAEQVVPSALPVRFLAARSLSTAIYFLLEQENFSAFHRIKSDECWHFYAGDPLNVYVIHPDGKLEIIVLGNGMQEEQQFQAIVPAGCWFASATIGLYSFVGCTVSPGFDFDDLEMAVMAKLIESFPDHELLIRRFCRS